MKQKKYPGTCLICKSQVTTRTAVKHCQKCLLSSGWPEGEEPSFLIKVRDHYDGRYWLLVLARRDALLDDLDRLLRDVWVECCGHLSAFTVYGEEYISNEIGEGESMEVPLSGLVAPGDTFTYEYDFGSTTELDLKVVAEIPVAPPDGRLCLVARNDRFMVPCESCGKPAEFFLPDYEECNPTYYCRSCLASADVEIEEVEIIANSPRNGVCAYTEDPTAALWRYPPGWTEEEIIPGDPEEFLESLETDSSIDRPKSVGLDEVETFGEGDLYAAVDAVTLDIGEEIDAFIEEEKEARGEEFATMAGESVTIFCTFMYCFHGMEIKDWDAQNVRRCLLEKMVQNPVFPEEWPENFVPIICRFLTRMEASGRIANAAALVAALEEAAPEFISAATAPDKGANLVYRILEKAESSGIDPNDTSAILNFVLSEYMELAGMDLNDTESSEKLMRHINDESSGDVANEIRNTMCLIRCKEFCSRFEDDTVFNRCVSMVQALSDHPSAPLSRGDILLWNAAVIYAACQDAHLIRPGRGGPPLGREIGSFFSIEVSSIRNKVKALRGFLPAQ